MSLNDPDNLLSVAGKLRFRVVWVRGILERYMHLFALCYS
jgi:hypothetical protein